MSAEIYLIFEFVVERFVLQSLVNFMRMISHESLDARIFKRSFLAENRC